MSQKRFDEIDERYVEDKFAQEFLFLQENGSDIRDLTGHWCEVAFWIADAAPHVVRAGTVDVPNGLVRYELRGDEYTAVGEVVQSVTVANPEYGGTSTGVGFFESSFPVVRRNVRRKPA